MKSNARRDSLPHGRPSFRIQALTGAALISTFLFALLFQSHGSGQGLTADPTAPEDLAAVVESLANPNRCLRAVEAESEVRARIAVSRSSGWRVFRDLGVSDATCVSATIDTVRHQVVLTQTMRPEVRVALDAFAETSYRECLTQKEAKDALGAVLERFAETGWRLRTDGPVGGPLDRLDAIEDHVQKGCWIYGGTGWTDDGTRLYYVSGIQ